MGTALLYLCGGCEMFVCTRSLVVRATNLDLVQCDKLLYQLRDAKRRAAMSHCDAETA